MKNADLAVLQPYCDDEMRMLRSISKSIISKFKERLTDADYDDFYSIANITLWLTTLIIQIWVSVLMFFSVDA